MILGDIEIIHKGQFYYVKSFEVVMIDNRYFITPESIIVIDSETDKESIASHIIDSIEDQARKYILKSLRLS